ELVPEAKVIFITRKYADVISSFTKQGWCPDNVKQATIMYRDIVRQIFSVREEINYDSLCEIEFEDLINNTHFTLDNICEFIDIPFDGNMLDVDLSKHNIDRYKKDLKQEDLDYINKVLF
ncbi:unnamed protein product, partial [marine sediment metagenome]